MKRGYARVSTEEQDLARQITALQQYGCDIIYMDKVSGTKDNRPELDKMFSELQNGDVVIVQKLDRLARSMIMLVETIKGFQAKGIGFVSITDNFDLSTSVGMLSFHILAAFSQFERDLISERTISGLAQKKRDGVVLGRRSVLNNDLIDKIREMKEGGQTITEIARKMEISRPTISKALAN